MKRVFFLLGSLGEILECALVWLGCPQRSPHTVVAFSPLRRKRRKDLSRTLQCLGVWSCVTVSSSVSPARGGSLDAERRVPRLGHGLAELRWPLPRATANAFRPAQSRDAHAGQLLALV